MSKFINIVKGNAKVGVQIGGTGCLDGQPGCDGGKVCQDMMKKRKELEKRGIKVIPYRGK